MNTTIPTLRYHNFVFTLKISHNNIIYTKWYKNKYVKFSVFLFIHNLYTYQAKN